MKKAPTESQARKPWPPVIWLIIGVVIIASLFIVFAKDLSGFTFSSGSTKAALSTREKQVGVDISDVKVKGELQAVDGGGQSVRAQRAEVGGNATFKNAAPPKP